jgi:hypothetical protein
MVQLYEQHGYDEETDQPVAITLEDLNKLRDDCRDVIALGDAVKALEKNSDFIKLIKEAYIQKEPKRLGQLIASGKMVESGMNGAFQDLKSIGNLNSFLDQKKQEAALAADHLESANQAYNEQLELYV